MLIRTLALTFSAVAFFQACAHSPEKLQKTMEEHPEILISVIEKHPEQFIAAFQKAAQKAQIAEGEKEEQSEKERMEAELKNPLQPSLDPDRAAVGPANAPIVIVEYSDFQCPFCSRGYMTVKEVMKNNPGKIRFIYKHLPLQMHPLAMPAAMRFEAIALQSAEKAYRFHDAIFDDQDALNTGGEKYLDQLAKKFGVNVAKMRKDMESEKVRRRIEADSAEAESFGISGTPGFVVAGVSVRGAYPAATFQEIIDKRLAIHP